MNNIEILYNILMSEDVVTNINNNLDILLEIVPELHNEIGFEHKHPHHHLDVWNHTLLALSNSKKDFIVRLALLFHDIGKPFSYTEEHDIRHFNGHQIVSEKITREILKRLNFDNDLIGTISYLVLSHDTPIKDSDLKNNIDISIKLYEIQRCDALAHNPEKLEKRINYLNKVREKIKSYKKVQD